MSCSITNTTPPQSGELTQLYYKSESYTNSYVKEINIGTINSVYNLWFSNRYQDIIFNDKATFSGIPVYIEGRIRWDFLKEAFDYVRAGSNRYTTIWVTGFGQYGTGIEIELENRSDQTNKGVLYYLQRYTSNNTQITRQVYIYGM